MRMCYKLNNRELIQNSYQFEFKIITDDTNIVKGFVEHHYLTNHRKGIICHVTTPLKSDTSCISSMGQITGCSQQYCARRNRRLNSQINAVAMQYSKILFNIKINYPGERGQLYQWESSHQGHFWQSESILSPDLAPQAGHIHWNYKLWQIQNT